LWCDGAETCAGASGCLAGTTPDCSDEYDCTDDSCVEDGGGLGHCDNTANDDYCSGDLVCNPFIFLKPSGCGNGACSTGADSVDYNGKISMPEIMNYIGKWKVNEVSMGMLMDAIGYWKIGAGC